MARIAKNKQILKNYFFQYHNQSLTMPEIAQLMDCSVQYISKVFKGFDAALDNAIIDKRGRPAKTDEAPGSKLSELKKVNQALCLKVFLLEAIVQFLLMFIKGWGRELGIKLNPYHDRLSGEIKRFLVETYLEFRKQGGKLSEFAKAINKDQTTVYRWIKRYESGKSLEDQQPPGKAKKEIAPWIKKAVLKLIRSYPLATDRGLAHLFNKLAGSNRVKVSPFDVKRIIAEEKMRIDSLRQKRKKRFDFSKIHISWDLDFMEFTINHLRYKALIVVEHHSRRLLYARVILEPTAEKVARIIKALGKHYNTLPTFIKADNGPEFRDTFKTLMASLNITVLNSPRYYPQFNGVVERLNGSIRRMVQIVTVTSVASVNTFLSRFLDTHNYTPHESLGWLTPIKVFRDKCHQNHPTFTEVITPYVKDDCIRIRFTRRNGNQGRLSFPCPNTD